MDFYAWNHGFSNLVTNGDDKFLKSSQSLVLDEEKGELVKAKGKVVGKKKDLSLSDEKALAALKSHSEAERRRRERINAHLDTLRGLVPCTDKMDKATLLAEVIRQVKQLKTNATQASTGLLIPQDADELKIEKVDQSLTFHISLCCKYRPELLTDIKRALVDLKVNISRAELSTLGDHMKIVFDFTKTENDVTDGDLVISVREALTSVLEKASILLLHDYSPRSTMPNKRRRYSL